MSVTQAEPAYEIVDDAHRWDRRSPQMPPPRKPPPENHGDGWGFEGDEEPRRSRLTNAHLGLLMLLVSETMLFAVLLGAFLVFRLESVSWPPPAFPKVPFWVTACSTMMLLGSAFTMWRALRALRQWESERGVRFLAFTVGLGGAFLALQAYEWRQLIRFGLELTSGVYGGAFFVLIGCHALHVCSALVWVMVIWVRNRHAEACMTRSSGVSLCSLYWYYVVAVWPVLYIVVYLI